MGFPERIANEALILCERSCCICHKFCGTKMELHHIKQVADGGDDTLENCIPLCFDCHSDMGKADPKHPKGKRYSENELRGHRDKWFKKASEITPQIAGKDISIADQKLFYKICDIFTDDIRVWLSEQDIGGAHPYGLFEPLVQLLYECDDPFFEFLNIELEKLKGNLFSSIKSFISYKSNNTFVKDLGGQNYAVTRQWMMNHEDWSPKIMSYEEAFVQYEEEAKKLNDLASDVWNSYLEFARQGRRLLNT